MEGGRLRVMGGWLVLDDTGGLQLRLVGNDGARHRVVIEGVTAREVVMAEMLPCDMELWIKG